MGFGPAYGTTGEGTGAVKIFTEKDGQPAIFSDTASRDAYFTRNPDELSKIQQEKRAVAIGSANQITAAYIRDNNQWVPIATNFKGEKGDTGPKGNDGTGLDPLAISNGGIPKWDSTQQKLVDSGITSTESGDIRIAPNSLSFGNHKMSSSVDNVVFTNTDNGKRYTPVWQTQEPGSNTAYIRAIGNAEEVVRVADGSADVVNPVNSGVTIDKDETFFGGKFTLTSAATNVELQMLDSSGLEVWRQELGDLSAGEHSATFTTPLDIKKNYRYDIKLYSSDGSDVVAKGPVAGTGGEFSWSILRSIWIDKEIAKEEWVKSLPLVTDATLIGDTLTFSLQDGSFKTVTLPANGGSLAAPYSFIHLHRDRIAAVSEFTSATPVYMFNEDAEISLTIPSIDVLPPGKDLAFIVANRSINTSSVIVKASGTNSINSAGTTSLTVPRTTTVLFISDFVSGIWYTILLEAYSGSTQTLDKGQIVKGIEAQSNGKDLLVKFYDDTNTTITLDGWSADIAKLNSAIKSLEKYTKNRTRFFVYKGSTAPTFQKRVRGGYYLTFYGLTSDINLTTPLTSTTITDGTILFIDNNSKDFYVNISTNPGETIEGKDTAVLLPETTAWYVRNNNDWQELYSGFLPSSHRELIAEIKTLISADNNFMRSLSVQSDDTSQIAAAVTSLEFDNFDVSTPSDDTTKGIIKFKGTTFENPDGTKVTTNILKLVNMEIVDPGDGTPPRLSYTGGNTPTPHPTGAYGLFDASETAPDTVDFTSLSKFSNGRVSLHKDNNDPKYAYILVPADEGVGADRIGELGGLPAFWSKTSKDYTVGGQSKNFIVFRSPYPLREQDVTLIIYH